MQTSHKDPDETLNVPQMAREAGVSDDKVRQWCRAGLIADAWNVGDSSREFYRASRKAFESFRQQRTVAQRRVVQEIVTRPARSKRNLLGI